MSFSVGYQQESSRSRSSASLQSNNGRSVLSMDEAYRRLGHKLSQRVNGSSESTTTALQQQQHQYQYQQQQQQQQQQLYRPLELGNHPLTAFSSNNNTAAAALTHPNELWNRSHKVSKKEYSDRGSHQQVSEDSILKKLTYHAKATFRTVESSKHNITPTKGIKKRMSPIEQSPQQRVNQLASIEHHHQQQQQQHGSSSTHKLLNNNNSNSSTSTNKGFLGSALTEQQTSTTPKTHKCLTQPSAGVSNDGMDNSEGNLVVFEGDIIQPINVHTVKNNTISIGTLKVIDLLGQGTFAQVFLCECQSTGHRIALKVVKNKQAYTRQAAIEIDVFRALSDSKVNMVQLESYFLHQHHLCLVFELLGLNLYEVLKRRQFRGLPLPTVKSLLKQAIDGVKDLSAKSIVHCDLKPENILLCSSQESLEVNNNNSANNHSNNISTTPSTHDTPETDPMSSAANSCASSTCNNNNSAARIKLIDFGSACFEGNTAHTYIQSRFYRSPEVLVGLPYDSAIDMWSLGCVAAELFLGLPILPGVHEHDQLGRISEMIAPLPDWMLEQGSKSTKYFAKQFTRPSSDPLKQVLPQRTPSPSESDHYGDANTNNGSMPARRPSWRIKSQQEYIQSLSASEIRKKGGLAKLEKQPANRYFKRKKLADIIMLHGKATTVEEKEHLTLFVHFLLGILDPDPWKRWTAFQASQHPFVTGTNSHRQVNGGSIHWVPPWDPSICRRKLLNVQKTREKQQSVRRSGCGYGRDNSRIDVEMRASGSDTTSTVLLGGSGSTNTSNVLSRQSTSNTGSDRTSPPSSLGISGSAQAGRTSSMTGSLGSVLGLHQADASGGMAQQLGPPTTMGDYGQLPSGIPASLMMASSAGLSYGDASVPSMMPHVGPQSYSGMSYEGGVGHVEAEFGYALQRPGIVPSTHELAGSYSSVGQHSVTSVGFSPLHHQLHQPRGMPSRSVPGLSSQSAGRNATTVPMMAPNRRGSRHRYNNNAPMPPSMMSQSYNMHNAPTSIREDSTDYQLGESSGASLLAQQLEEQAAIARDALCVSEVQHQLRNHPAYVRAPMYGGGGGYYTTYVTADGTPFVASSLDMQATTTASMGHMTSNNAAYHHAGNYSDQHAPMHAMQQQQYNPAPPSIHQHHQQQQYAPYQQQQQPTMEQLERARQKEAGLPPGSVYHRGLSM